jgi:hypothetical protein
VPFDRRRFLALTLLRWLLVVLTTTKLGKDSSLFTGTLEAPQGSIKILVFFYAKVCKQKLGTSYPISSLSLQPLYDFPLNGYTVTGTYFCLQ